MNNQEGIRIPLSLSEKYEDFEQEWYRADSKKDFLNHLFNEGVMIDALYDKNPKEFFDAKPIHIVYEINDEIIGMAGDKGSSFGTGGMLTKISAASLCMENGIDMAIVDGSEPLNINEVIEGQNIGTLFIGGKK